MIRTMERSDLETVMQIWLDTNKAAHSFISKEYWQMNVEPVKEMLPQAEVYVYEDSKNAGIKGFLGITGTYIAGIFVSAQAQSAGIGKQLLDYAKTKKQSLSLHVYQKNKRAVSFYLREHFSIRQEAVDGHTGEAEFLMEWTKG